MRVVQTFWSGGKDPLIDSFGWLSPQHHFMSWALSCLTLRQNYDEVFLYTDSVGYAIFAEQLSLPYSEIIIQYDNLDCHPTHWAYRLSRTDSPELGNRNCRMLWGYDEKH